MCINVNGGEAGDECVDVNNMRDGAWENFGLGVHPAAWTNKANYKIDEFRVSDYNVWAAYPPVTIDLNLWKIDDYPVSGQFPTFRNSDDGNLTIDFNVFNSGNLTMTADINYHTSNSQGVGTVLVNDLNLSSLVCTNAQEWSVDDANCSWDFNISSVSDGNYFVLLEITDGTNSIFKSTTKSFEIESQSATVTIRDENFGYPLVSTTVAFNGVDYTPNAIGKLSLPISGLSGRYTIEVEEDNNYPTRYFTLDLNSSIVSLDLNLYMLQDNNGQNISFKFYDIDQTTVLQNYKVYALHDGNFAGIRYMNANGETSFFLDPDDNYVFDIVKSESEITRYHPTELTINIPKDEATLANISPFNVDGGLLSDVTWTAQTAAIKTSILSNTTNFYKFDVNGGVSYYPRDYLISVKGNPATHSLQPYLTKKADSINYTFYVLNRNTGAGIENVRMVIKLPIAGVGLVTVVELITDSAGIAQFPLIIGETYTFEFYIDGVLKDTDTLTPTSDRDTYQIDMEIDTIPYVEVTIPTLDLNFLPVGSQLFLNDINFVDFNVAVGMINATITSTTLRVSNCGRDINTFIYLTPTIGTVYSFSFDANTSNPPYFDSRCPIELVVGVVASDGNVFKQIKTYTIRYDTQYDLLTRLSNLADDLNPEGNLRITSLLAFFLTMVMVGSVAAAGFRDPMGLGVLVGILLGIFTFIGFLPPNVFIFAIYAGFMMVLLLFGRRI